MSAGRTETGGVAPDVAIEMSCLRLLAGDRLLLCSDGAYDGVLDLALADGRDDNASAVAAFVSHAPARSCAYCARDR